MKLSSQTIVLSVALAATAIDASSRYLVRNRKTNRNLIKVEPTGHTSLEEIVHIDDSELFRELMGANGDMSMSMPNSSGSSSSDGESSSSGSSDGENSSGESTSGGETISDGSKSGDGSGDGDGDGDGSSGIETAVPSTKPDETEVPVAAQTTPPVESPTADAIVIAPSEAPLIPGSTPLDAPTAGESTDAPTSSSSSRQNIAMAATTITIALTVVPFIY